MHTKLNRKKVFISSANKKSQEVVETVQSKAVFLIQAVLCSMLIYWGVTLFSPTFLYTQKPDQPVIAGELFIPLAADHTGNNDVGKTMMLRWKSNIEDKGF